jgi:hypothetical protein
MDLDEAQTRIIEELKRREINAWRTSFVANEPPGISLSMWANGAQRLLGFLVSAPLDV